MNNHLDNITNIRDNFTVHDYFEKIENNSSNHKHNLNDTTNNMTMYTGKLNLIIGCMFSGKTTELINQYYRNTIAGKKCVMVKYSGDNRYDSESVATHSGIHVNAISTDNLGKIENNVSEYDAIFIDEVQFYSDAVIYCDKWANEGKYIFACGLSGTFQRKPFKIISELIPLADNILFLRAVCKHSGKSASFTKRLTKDKELEIIGGSDMYEATSREYFFY